MPLLLAIKVTVASAIVIAATATATVTRLISSRSINEMGELLVFVCSSGELKYYQLRDRKCAFRLPRAWVYVCDCVNSGPILQNSLIINEISKSEVHETSKSSFLGRLSNPIRVLLDKQLCECITRSIFNMHNQSNELEISIFFSWSLGVITQQLTLFVVLFWRIATTKHSSQISGLSFRDFQIFQIFQISQISRFSRFSRFPGFQVSRFPDF